MNSNKKQTISKYCQTRLHESDGKIILDVSSSLYHYTNISGLSGMLEAKNIYATNILYLNDKSELQHGINIINASIFEKIDEEHYKENSNDFLLLFLKKCKEYFNKIPNDNIYTTSFSTKEDSLSQWRGYSSINNGYCILFDLHDFWFHIADKGEILNVIYEKKMQYKIINSILDDAFEYITRLYSDFHRIPEETFIDLTNYLHLVVPAFKDSGFSEEKEIRLVIRDKSYIKDNLKFRKGSGHMIPYIEIPFQKQINDFPIKNITIGPLTDFIFSQDSLFLYLESLNLKNITVNGSSIPLR